MIVIDSKIYESEIDRMFRRFVQKGFAGRSIYNFGLVIADDELQGLLKKDPQYIREVKKVITRAKLDDWGEVTFKDRMECSDLKLHGSADGTFGVYGTLKGYLRLDVVEIDVNGKLQPCTLISLGKFKGEVYAQNGREDYAINQVKKHAAERFVKERLKFERVI